MLYYLSTEKNILESDTLVNIYFVAIQLLYYYGFCIFENQKQVKLNHLEYY